MSGAAPERGRPLSGGLWSLWSPLGWLRRHERGRGSCDSLSSGGSDRTTASFAFLPPHSYAASTAPAPLPPPPPPTDSYRKRVRDRNIRRQYERDITLHRKYRLPLGEGSPGFDAFSLPSVRRSVSLAEARQERERRATSESLQRRAAYVPGKRRAPPPPSPLQPSAEFRRRATKRPAPQPPHLRPDAQHNTLPRIKEKENSVQMSSKPFAGERNSHDNDKAAGCKSEKYSKKDSQTKPKLRQEKSFLKHIFENRKRNSAIEPATVKLLPSISELDRQAAELMQTFKLKAYERGDNDASVETKNDTGSNYKGDAWFCTRCLKKYDSTMVTCLDCLSEAKVSDGSAKYKDQCLALKNIYTQIDLNAAAETSTSSKDDEKQKLKEMLKEMKDSLPKRTRPQKSGPEKVVMTFKGHPDDENKISIETPTLPMGSSIQKELDPQPSSSKQSDAVEYEPINEGTSLPLASSKATETVLVTQTIVLTDPGLKVINKTPRNKNEKNPLSENHTSLVPDIVPLTPMSNRNEPLKISSLLNPIYIPKSSSSIPVSQSNNFVAKKTFLEGSKPVAVAAAGTSAQVIKAPTSVLGNITTKMSQKVKESPPSSPKIRSIQPQVTNNKITHLQTEAITSTSSAATTNQVNDILKTINEPNRNNSESKLSPTLTQKSPIEKIIPKAVVETKSEMAKPGTSLLTENKGPRFTPELLCKRRELISQLEKSIASGDERAAAEAAIRLAQLKLSCSVLSFSSQIIAEDTPSSSAAVQKPNPPIVASTKTNAPAIKTTSSKVNSSTQSIGTKCIKLISTPSTPSKDNATENRNTSVLKETSPPKVTSAPTKGSNTSNVTVATRPSTSQGLQKFSTDETQTVPIEVWVEDREAARGPINLNVSRQSTLGLLRREAETSLGIPARLQRWIVGRALCNDDSVALASLAGPAFDAPFYLYLVESETNRDSVLPLTNREVSKEIGEETGDVYSELVQLELRAIVPNAEVFECGVCMEDCEAGAGVVLRDCVHAFCRDCLAASVRHCEEPAVACPATGCSGTLQEREIRTLVPPEQYERWLARGLAAAESGSKHAFHCRTRDCTGWALAEPGVQRFPCPVCRRTNCVPCQAIHEGDTCEQHRERLRAASTGTGVTDEGTHALLESLIARGEALECPECSAVITKKWGCDWVRCSACKTEICWVTRGRRWGPAGRGDTSAGCRCGVDGKRCHPSCGYCH